jgi:hypothetical protein
MKQRLRGLKHRLRWPAALALLALLASPPALDRATAQSRDTAAAQSNDAATAQSSDAAAAAAAHAALPPAEWDAIRKTIGEQLAALRAGDGARAYAFASPGIRERFGDAPTFLRMVRDSYAPLLDARYTEFLDGAVIDGRTIQPLRLVLADDRVLVALYEMQRDDTGRWRIAGCALAPSTVRST